MSRFTFKYRLYPSRQQREKLEATLDVCRVFAKLAYKAERAGRQLVAVAARGTSQRYPCGEPNIKLLRNREHVCVQCGLATTRDHASAMETLRLGLSLQSLTAVQ